MLASTLLHFAVFSFSSYFLYLYTIFYLKNSDSDWLFTSVFFKFLFHFYRFFYGILLIFSLFTHFLFFFLLVFVFYRCFSFFYSIFFFYFWFPFVFYLICFFSIILPVLGFSFFIVLDRFYYLLFFQSFFFSSNFSFFFFKKVHAVNFILFPFLSASCFLSFLLNESFAMFFHIFLIQHLPLSIILIFFFICFILALFIAFFDLLNIIFFQRSCFFCHKK